VLCISLEDGRDFSWETPEYTSAELLLNTPAQC